LTFSKIISRGLQLGAKINNLHRGVRGTWKDSGIINIAHK